MSESVKQESSEDECDSEDVQKYFPKDRPYICPFDNCYKSYTRQAHLKRHQDTHGIGYRCTVENCEQIFKTKVTLKHHNDNFHLKKNPKKYKCTVCGEEFNKHNWLTRHQYGHTGIKPYKCTVEGCERRFLVPSKLKRHLKVHEGYPCTKENCGQIFPKWNLLVTHKKNAHPTIHKCDYCDKTFKTFYNLKGHVEIHMQDRDVYLCPQPNCSRFYFMKRNLKHHLKVYHERRPFVCPKELCGKAFKTEANLNKHLSSHNPKKRYRKKKKKKPKPSFAARLAGLVPKKTRPTPKTDHEKLEDSMEQDEKTENNKCEDNSQELCSEIIDCNVPNSSREDMLIEVILNYKDTMLERKSFDQENVVECISA